MAVFLCFSIAASAAEETDPVLALDTLVVSATRTPQEAGLLPSSVSLVSLDELDDAQISDLRTALATLPGVNVATSGAPGGQTSVLLRGASSHQVLFFIDGVRMNDRSAAYFNFLGGADLAGLERFELLRGPQSTLYGSSAMGGVILLETARGQNESSGTFSAGAGSFGNRHAIATTSGARAGLSYSGAVGYARAENDRPRNDFDQWSGAARLEGRPAADLLLGATVRLQRGDYQEPGSRFFATEADIAADNTLITTYAEWAAQENVRSRLTYGWHARDYRYTDMWGTSTSRNRRDILDWQTTWRAAPGFEVVAGANAEWSRYDIADWRTTDRVFAGYLSTTTQVSADLVLTAGLRHDQFRSSGDATTGRGGLAWQLPDGRTHVRATYGTGFSAPGSDDRYGVPQWGQLANAALKPEKSHGWDLGIDHDFASRQFRVGATFFQNRFRNLFDYEIIDFATFAGRTVNRIRARTQGVELTAQVRPHEAVIIFGSYTFLDAIDLADDSRLARRPRHTADVDVRVHPARAWLFGIGMHRVANRYDSGTRFADYTTVRLYARYAVRENLALKLRIENALDRSYEEVLGYAALPRGFHGSVDWEF